MTIFNWVFTGVAQAVNGFFFAEVSNIETPNLQTKRYPKIPSNGVSNDAKRIENIDTKYIV